MDIGKEILDTIQNKGEPSEEYERMISRQDLLAELMAKGCDKESIDNTLASLCNDGTLAMDELNVYQYDFPGKG
jgi:hypothetical protein